jgi:hypothetical protein
VSTPSGTPRTIGDVARWLAPGRHWRDLGAWPPDVFATAGTVLHESGAYRLVVSPPAGFAWPPPISGGEWTEVVRQRGRAWAASVAPGQAHGPRPKEVGQLVAELDRNRNLPLSQLATPACWTIACNLLTLFAMADEACAGVVGSGSPLSPFHVQARSRLARTGSLARLDRDRVRVLPKLRVPESGITIRSLSRHVALEHSEVAAEWLDSFSVESESLQNRFTLLLVPWPSEAFPGEFRRVKGPLVNLDESTFGFFEYSPQTAFDPRLVLELALSAAGRVGPIDAVVLPESVLVRKEADALQTLLLENNIPYLVAGIRQPGSSSTSLGANYAFLGGRRSDGTQWSIEQYKHHRWFLDRGQIEQYHLGPALDPNRRWWEAIDVSSRHLTFVGIRDWLTLCPLICEDLARPDPVASLLRAVGPSLVIALLLDGPQLATRWPARYATVLADDPGCAVLTLSSLGLVRRSKPPSVARSRIVGLWKEHRGVPREIELEEGAEAIALTVSSTRSKSVTADGRAEEGYTADVVMSGVEQIYRAPSPAPARPKRARSKPAG